MWKWKLKVNSNKTKIVIFRKAGSLPRNLSFRYGNIEIVKSFSYLGVTFTQGGSFNDTQCNLADKALKAIFRLNKYLQKFKNIEVSHKME